MDFNAIKARYNAAFDAYQQVTKGNAERQVAGEKPSQTDLDREAAAKGALENARRALFAALAATSTSD
jgi:hypothetical protein